MSNIPVFTIIRCEPEFPWLKSSITLKHPQKDDQQLLYFSKGESPPFDWQQINEETRCICHKGEICRFGLLRHTPFRWKFSLGDWMSDEDGYGYDFQINGQTQINNAQAFLAKAPVSGIFTVEMLNAALQQELAATVDNALTQLRNDFGDNNLLFGGKAEQSRDWFSRLMQPVFSSFGCMLQENLTLHWYSEKKITAEKERLEKLRIQEENNRLQWKRQMKLERKQSRMEYKQNIRDIETEATLDELQREKKIEAAKRERLLELTAKDHQLAAREREEALRVVEHEKELARLMADTEAIKNAVQKKEKIEEQWLQEKRRMEILYQAVATQMKSIDAQINRIESNVTAKLEEESRLFQKAEWLHNWGVRAEDLEYAGLDNQRQLFFDILKKQQDADERVRIYMSRLVRSRDAACAGEEKRLSIGSELHFEISSELCGYLTILNLGTSGRLWLNVPNSYITEAVITDGQTLAMPGKGTLPWSGLDKAGLEYVEMGPGGWERMAAIVTPQPLIHTALLHRSSPGAPLVLIGKEDLAQIRKQLERFNQGEWSAAILRFLVKG